jgi:hypothetical protein
MLLYKRNDLFSKALLMLALITSSVYAQTPDVPVTLEPTDIVSNSFTANWEAATGATAYRLEVFVEYPSGMSGQPIWIYEVGNVLTKTVSVLYSGSRVEYKVKAINGGDESAFSGVQNFYLPPHRPMGGYPVPCTYEIGQTYFHSPAMVSPGMGTGATGTLTEVARDVEFADPIAGSPFEHLMGQPPAMVTPLEPGTTYVVHYAYFNPGGVTEYSLPAFAVTTLPATPELESTGSTHNSISLAWEAPQAATGYYLDLSKDNFTNFVVGYNNLLLTGVTTYTISGLDPLTTYQVRIRAKGECGSTPNSNVIATSTLAIEPIGQPTALAFSNITSTDVTVSFTNATGTPSGYLVLYRPSSSPVESPIDGTAYTAGNTLGTSTIAYVGASNTTTLSGLAAETPYFFDVFSYNGATGYNYLTTSPLEGSVTTRSSEPASQPTNINFSSITETTLNMSFTAADGSTGYLVLSKAGSAPTETPVDGTAYSAGTSFGASKVVSFNSTTTISDAGLSAGTVYFYSVFSFNGNTGTYNFLTSSPLQGSQVTLPSVPALTTHTVTQSAFQVTWSAVASATNYALDVSTDNFSTFIADYSGKLVGNVTSASVPGLSSGTSYKARLRAINAAGASTNSNIQTALTLPGNPVLAAATALTSGSFTVSWTAVPGATGYLLDISIDDFNNFVAGYNGLAVSGTNYTATSLNPATTFKIRIRAANSSGPSENSNVISATTLEVPPTSPLAMGAITFASRQDNSTTQTLNISVTGGKAPYSVEFKHKGILSANYTSAILTATTPGNYSFAITPALLDELGVSFEAIATDANAATDKETGKIYVAFSESQSPALPFEHFGGTDETWNLFSIPFELDNKSISSIFAGYDPDRHEYDWRIMRYRTGTNDYVNFNTGQVKLGEAYWFNAKENLQLRVGAGQTAAQVPFILSLVQGWNLIGNPYTVGISWNQVLADNTDVTGSRKLANLQWPSAICRRHLSSFRRRFRLVRCEYTGQHRSGNCCIIRKSVFHQ